MKALDLIKTLSSSKQVVILDKGGNDIGVAVATAKWFRKNYEDHFVKYILDKSVKNNKEDEYGRIVIYLNYGSSKKKPQARVSHSGSSAIKRIAAMTAALSMVAGAGVEPKYY